MKVDAESGRQALHLKIETSNEKISEHLEDHSKRITILETIQKVG
jgi:hypothetical protein